MNIETIGLVVKPQSPLAADSINRAIAWGDANGIKVLIDLTSAKLIKSEGLDHCTLMDSVDALLVLGGDGTFLATARKATTHNVPLLGVNLGSLGFITEVAIDELEEAMQKLKDGKFEIEERMMIDVVVKNDQKTTEMTALNDVVLTRKNIAKMIELSISVNREQVTNYKADGLIIASPTGSTAYALSTGGPILYPTLDALVICPICPHTLTNRPVVMAGDSVIEVDINAEQDEVIATLDGQESIDINEHDHLTITRSKNVTRLIKVPGRTHYDTLRQKLRWGGSSKPNE